MKGIRELVFSYPPLGVRGLASRYLLVFTIGTKYQL
jgi:hypothetical protein